MLGSVSLFLGLAVGCGGGGGSSGSGDTTGSGGGGGSPGGQTLDQACAAYAKASCDNTTKCEPFVEQISYANDPACEARTTPG